MARAKALLLLWWAVVRVLLRRLILRRPDGVARFREHYDADGLPSVTAEERIWVTGFGRCIACGLCDRGEGERIERSGGAYRGVMPLVLAATRNMPDFRAAAYSFSFVDDETLAQKERLCPTAVPLRRLAQFVREKAAAVGGPLELPPRTESLPPAAGDVAPETGRSSLGLRESRQP